MMTMIFQPREFNDGDPDHDANHAMRRIVVGIMMIFAVAFILMVMALYAFAGDPTGFWKREIAAGRAPQSEWWNTLANRHKGLCCSHADGLALRDVDWDANSGHYRVYARGWVIGATIIPDGWIDVPPDAVVDDPNLYGQAVVWPYIGWKGEQSATAAIRCFMPGAQG